MLDGDVTLPGTAPPVRDSHHGVEACSQSNKGNVLQSDGDTPSMYGALQRPESKPKGRVHY